MNIIKYSKLAYLSLAIVSIAGLGLSFVGYLAAVDWENNRINIAFEREIEQVTASLEKEVNVNLAILEGLQGLYSAAKHVDRNEFTVFAGPLLERHPTIQALEWVPRVPGQFRERYEKKAQAEGHEYFQFMERTTDGSLVRASERAEYYPVYYVEPLKGNEPALGFDLASNEARHSTLITSAETGQALASPPITLVQGTGVHKGSLVVFPVFKKPTISDGQETRGLKGFVIGVFRIEQIIQITIENRTTSAHIFVFDSTTDEQAIPIYGKERPIYGKERVPTVQADTYRTIKRDVLFAARRWTLTAIPTNQFIESHQSWHPRAIWGVGISFTLLFSILVLVFSNREREVRKIVAERTKKLTAVEKRTRAILDTSLSAIIAINEKAEIILFNPAAERMFGYTAAEVKGKNVRLLMPEPDQSQHDTYLKNYITTGKAQIIGTGREVIGATKSGETFPIQLSVGEAKIEDQRMFVGIIVDITIQKNIEKSLIFAKKRAEESNRLKSEFLSTVSHELRTPLTVILGYPPLLSNPSSNLSPDIIKEIGQDIDRAGTHLMHMINDLLDFSKIEAGSLQLNVQNVKLRDSVKKVCETFDMLADNKGVEIRDNIQDFTLAADPIRLEQILINLVNNALKFTSKGYVELSACDGENFVEISVRDTGCGIKADDLNHIFDHFRQADASSTRAAQGTGLGLAIVKKLVEAHGGHIKVESQCDSGSRFIFTIPKHMEDE